MCLLNKTRTVSSEPSEQPLFRQVRRARESMRQIESESLWQIGSAQISRTRFLSSARQLSLSLCRSHHVIRNWQQSANREQLCTSKRRSLVCECAGAINLTWIDSNTSMNSRVPEICSQAPQKVDVRAQFACADQLTITVVIDQSLPLSRPPVTSLALTQI